MAIILIIPVAVSCIRISGLGIPVDPEVCLIQSAMYGVRLYFSHHHHRLRICLFVGFAIAIRGRGRAQELEHGRNSKMLHPMCLDNSRHSRRFRFKRKKNVAMKFLKELAVSNQAVAWNFKNSCTLFSKMLPVIRLLLTTYPAFIAARTKAVYLKSFGPTYART